MSEVVFGGAISVPQGIELAGERIGPWIEPTVIERSYDPFVDETGLFLEFSRTDPESTESILGFARKYGIVSQHIDEWRQRVIDMRKRVSHFRSTGEAELFPLLSKTFSIVYVPRETAIETRILSADLWTCLQLQFNMSSIDDWLFRDCAHCGKTFAIIPPATRQNRVYCSVACSSAAYRVRKTKKAESKQEPSSVTPKKRKSAKKGTR